MYRLMVLVVWAVLALVDVCGAPAVSLSFGGKSKNDTEVVFACRNGSWVSVGGKKIYSVKGSSQVKKDDTANFASDLDDLFRKINLTLARKMAPVGEAKPVRGTSEKPLGELFLEWLSKHEATVKPVAALKSTPIPVVGLQIDFDEGSPARTTGRDFAGGTSHPKISLVDIPLILGLPARKSQKSGESNAKPRNGQNSPLDRPINYYLEPEISQVKRKGLNSDDDLKTQFYVRKRRGKSDVDDSVKFIIEPLTILPFDLGNSDLSDLSLNSVQTNLTKRDVKISDFKTHRKFSETQNLTQNDVKLSEARHVRRQRGYIDFFTPAPAKAQSVQPAHKMPKFDEGLPVESHVKKRHGKLLLNPKPLLEVLPPTPAAEESYSGQLLVRNEIPSDRKDKLNDLPKYVMKFLSQCKALIEQNYDEGAAKDNNDEDDALPTLNDSPNDKPVKSHFATDRTTLATHSATANAEIDEFESISINKRPMKKKAIKNDKEEVKLLVEPDSVTDAWAQSGQSPKVINDAQPKSKPKKLLSTYEGDDLYDEDLDLNIGDGSRQNEEKVNRKTYYTSSNASTCRSIFENNTPSTENYSSCSEEPEVTTLSSEQWKVLMDILNERSPCPTSKRPTTYPGKKKTVKEATTTQATQISSDSDRNGNMTSTSQKSDSGRNADSKSTKSALLKQRTTCQTTETTCVSTITPTTTYATTTTVLTTTTTTCSTPTTEIASTNDCSDTEGPTEECTETPAPKNIKQKNKPAMPQRYLIKIETSKPKHYNELSHLQGRSRPNSWFENIKNLKLLDSLRSNQNPMKVSYNVINPKSAPLGVKNDQESAEKMIAEGVIPLKTGSSLNLYISYVLNKTKANKGKVPISNNVQDDKLPGASVPQKQHAYANGGR